jgi:hypothetical protein
MAGFYGGYMGNAGATTPPGAAPQGFGIPQPGSMVAGNPFGPQFVIPQRGIRGMTPTQIEDLKQWDPRSAQDIDNIYRGVKPGGVQLPMASINGQVPMGNAGFFAGPQYGQMPVGYANKTVS